MLGLLGGCAVSACASLGGLASGSDGGDDAGAHFPDASRHPDARAADAGRDATAADVQAGDAGGGLDSSSADAIADGGVADVKPGADAHHDGCSPVPVLMFTPGTCAPAEAGACAPQPVARASVTWHAPHQRKGACTPTLAHQYYDACIGPASTTDACNAFYAEPGGLFCANCLVSDVSVAAYGSVIVSGMQPVYNIGGCVALVDPCNQPCAEEEEAETLCVFDSCSPSCFPDGGESLAQYFNFIDCSNTALGCSCLPEHSSAVACQQVLESAPKSAPCYNFATDELTWLVSVGGVFCGDGTFWDAGVLDSGALDAAASDGSSGG
jgi:hypothetical protein